MSHRIWNRGSNGLPKLVQPYAPSILFPVRHPAIGPGSVHCSPRMLSCNPFGGTCWNGSRGLRGSQLVVEWTVGWSLSLIEERTSRAAPPSAPLPPLLPSSTPNECPEGRRQACLKAEAVSTASHYRKNTRPRARPLRSAPVGSGRGEGGRPLCRCRMVDFTYLHSK